LVHALGAPITLASGATVTVADPASAANRQLIVTSDITFAGTTGNWAGEFDLGVNDLDLPAGSLADVTNQIKQGLTTGSSTGLISSVALADTTHFATLGVISNTAGNGNALYGSTTALGEFDGISPGVNAVLVKYTFLGDANLDGTVNAADFALINAGFTGHLTGWYNGDFNYDGTVDGSDYTLIDDAFNNQGGAPNSTAEIATPTTQLAASAAVPEPAMVGLLACAAGVLRRRRSA
jgi:hypothetical protein